MSTTILPDGSVVVRLALQTVHVDVRTRAIHLRAPSRDELSGSILESFPQSAVSRIRLIRDNGRGHLLFMELRSGRVLSLGQAPSQDMAMVTARVVADLTRCRVEVSDGPDDPGVLAVPTPVPSAPAAPSADHADPRGDPLETAVPDTVEESLEGTGLPPYEGPVAPAHADEPIRIMIPIPETSDGTVCVPASDAHEEPERADLRALEDASSNELAGARVMPIDSYATREEERDDAYTVRIFTDRRSR